MYQKLLESCTSEKIRRLDLFLSEESESEYYPKLDINKIPLDLNKNVDYSFNQPDSNHIFKYNIEVPTNLNVKICKYDPSYRKEFIT